MGGTISVTIREARGTEHRMFRWTNTLPWFVRNFALYQPDSDAFLTHIKGYMSDWFAMKADYEAHKIDLKFKYPMTDTYFPGEGLAPDGYGLVVFDFQNNVFLSMQSYCSLDSFLFANYMEEDKELVANIAYLKEAGRLIVTRDEDLDWDQIKMNIAPYTLINYPETAEGAMDMRVKIDELGFKLSKEEEAQWKSWMEWKNRE